MGCRARAPLWLGAAAALAAVLLFCSNPQAAGRPLHRNYVAQPSDQLITYCFAQAQSTLSFAEARDEGVTLADAKVGVEREVRRRNGNELIGDNVPIYIVAILFQNIDFAYEHPTLTPAQAWDRRYRRCVVTVDAL